MKRISNISFWLALLLLGKVAFAQQSVNTVKYNVGYDAASQTYTAYLIPDYQVPNSNNPLTTEKGSTAQFTLVVPPAFVVTLITDIHGTWTKAPDLLKLGPGQPNQDWSAYSLDPALNYYVVGKSPSETDYGSFQIGQPVALFSFKGNGCFGPIRPLAPNELFITAADQQYALNVADSFNSRSAQPKGGNQEPLEQFVNISGASADCAPPIILTANPDNATTTSGTPTTTPVLANDTNTGQPARNTNAVVSITTPPAVGTAVVNPDGTITYTAPATFTGVVCYSYKICDLTSTTTCSAPAQVCVTVVTPTSLLANPDNATTTSGTPTTTPVLANDTNTGQPATTANATVSITTPPAVGTAVVNPDGTITYTAPATFTGVVCYAYRICDLTSTTTCSAPAQVCVTVVIPTSLMANPDNATTTSGTPTTTPVLANDTNTGQPATTANATVSITTPPAVGTAVVNPDGTITYTAPATFTGVVCYSYKICDLTSTTTCSAPAQVCISVQGVMPPVSLSANPNSVTITAGTPTNINVLGNDTNTGQPASAKNVTVSITTPPAVGTAVVNPDGTISFSPPVNFTGAVCFAYKICDLISTTACSTPAQVCVNIVPKPPGNADIQVSKRIVGSKMRTLGDVVTYAITVRNLGPDQATNVVVKDSLSSGLQYQSAAVTTGTGTFTNPLLTLASLASGDSAVLMITAKIIMDGIAFNYVNVVSQDQTDPNPVNNRDQTCVSVPINLCTGEAIVASVPAGFADVKWYKAGTQVATGNSVTFTTGGTYTFTASNTTCPAEGCCPLVVVQTDCCPINACVPVVITRTRPK